MEAFEALVGLRARMVALEAGSGGVGGADGTSGGGGGLSRSDIQVAGLLETNGGLLSAQVCGV